MHDRDPVGIGIAGLVVLVLAFAAASKAGDEVHVAGVKVGEVTDVGLDGARVRVRFRASDLWLGDRTAAAIKLKTLLGQKYLALDPVGESPLDSVIPAERALAPYDVLDAFRNLSTTATAIDTEQLARSFDVVSQALAGTSMRGALDGLSRLSNTIASRDAELSELLRNARQVSQTLAERDEQPARLVADGNLVLPEVAAREQAVSSLLTGARDLSRQLRGLVSDNDAQLGPVLTSLDRLTGMLQRNQEFLAHGTARLAPLIRVATNLTGHGHRGDTYVCLPVVSGCY